jgi:uncharacterized protein YgbK (DUF1537 family)
VLAVIDDDPTGAQAEADIPLLVAWGEELMDEIGRRRPRAFHLLTNSRALEPADAYRVVRNASEAVAGALPEADIVLRGDSTLRAHLLEEYRGLRDAAFAGEDTALMLVPALPPAGRVTVDGVHRLERDGVSVPLHETEYARDGGFSYRSSRLLEWAEERSAGHFPTVRGRELHLAELREGGPEAVASALERTAAPAVFAPDARTDADLDLIAAGLREALDRGTPVIVRSAPAFVGRLAHTAARGLVPAPRAERGLLVACGSYVPTTTRQLARLVQLRPGALVEVETAALASSHAAGAISRAIAASAELLERGGLAIVSTTRELDARGFAHGQRIANGLARIVAGLRARVDVVLSKGGITSAVNLSDGLGALEADVIGPLADGISLWRVTTPEGERMSYVVFPGNVGGDDALADVVEMLAPA